jgi:hypothetical protein
LTYAATKSGDFAEPLQTSPSGETGPVKLNMLSMDGKNVETIINSGQKEGNYRKDVSVSDLPEGVNILRLQVKDQIVTKKFVKLK